MNFNDVPITYHAIVNDLGRWGSWRIDPDASVTVPPNDYAILYLHLQTNELTPAGTKKIELTISTRDQQTALPIRTYVWAPYQRARRIGTFSPELLLLLLAVIILGALLVLAVFHLKRRHPELITLHTLKRTPKRPTKRTTRKATKKKTPETPRKKISIENVRKKKRKTYY